MTHWKCFWFPVFYFISKFVASKDIQTLSINSLKLLGENIMVSLELRSAKSLIYIKEIRMVFSKNRAFFTSDRQSCLILLLLWKLLTTVRNHFSKKRDLSQQLLDNDLKQKPFFIGINKTFSVEWRSPCYILSRGLNVTIIKIDTFNLK